VLLLWCFRRGWGYNARAGPCTRIGPRLTHRRPAALETIGRDNRLGPDHYTRGFRESGDFLLLRRWFLWRLSLCTRGMRLLLWFEVGIWFGRGNPGNA
jgi:hypothetical protein